MVHAVLDVFYEEFEKETWILECVNVAMYNQGHGNASVSM